MSANTIPDSMAAADTELSTPECSPNPGLDFDSMSREQLITLQGVPPKVANLPCSFVLVPHNENGSLSWTVRDVRYPFRPPRTIAWFVQEATIGTNAGVSIVLQDNLGDLLVLNSPGSGKNPNDVERTWNSSLTTAEGTWTSTTIREYRILSRIVWWNFLLEPDNDNGDDKTRTVIAGFLLKEDGSKYTDYEQIFAYPAKWRATFKDPEPDGIVVTLVSPENKKYCLTSGSFSGGLGHLVCRGNYKRRTDSNSDCPKDLRALAKDGGNWTGTSGGPIVSPSAVP